MENENWLKINEFDNYSISNFGNVRNDKTNRILKKSKSNGYLVIGLENKQFRVHRLVAFAFIPNPDNKEYVDHIDGNKINNHILNLRWASCQENNRNQKMAKHNTSGVKGVSWNKEKQKWRVFISINDQYKHLGYFVNIDDAIKKRQEIAKQQFGEFINICELSH